MKTPMKTCMKTLLWKDFHQNRRVLLAVTILLLVPYVFFASTCVYISITRVNLNEELTYDPPREERLMFFFSASMMSLCLSVLTAAFIGGNAIAGERADRSAEFAAYLPISRWHAVKSKAFLGSCVCLVCWLANVLVLYAIAAERDGRHHFNEVHSMMQATGTTILLLFGVSWLFSSRLRNPGIATVSGLGSVVILAGILASIYDFTIRTSDNPSDVGNWGHWYLGLALILGITCFVAGVIYYLRRVEP